MAEQQVIIGKVQTWVQTLRQWATLILAVLAALGGGVAAMRPAVIVAPPPTTAPTAPPMPMPMPEREAPGPQSLRTPPDPWQALGRIQFGNAGCTATIVGPRRADGRWDVLTAAHCLKDQPREGNMVLRNGTQVRLTYMMSEPTADYCWLVTTLPVEKLPYALLSDALPSPGDKVYHGGWGVDQPGNREDGEVIAGDNGQGQSNYRLSVSSGDSGGGIALDSSGRILSPVCCTSAKGRKASVWGATCIQCAKGRPLPSLVHEEWTPIDVPIRN